MRRWTLLAALVVGAWLLSGAGTVSAQTALDLQTASDAETAAPPETPEAARALVARLSDAEVRALLLDRLDAATTEDPDRDGATADILEFLAGAGDAMFESVFIAVERAPLLWENQRLAFVNFHAALGWNGIGILFGSLLAALIAGLAAEGLFSRATRRWHDDVDSPRDGTLKGTLKYLSKRLCREIAGLFIFIVVARMVGRGLVGTPELQAFGGVLFLNIVFLPRVGAAFSRFVFAPKDARLRLLHADDATARFVHRHMVGIFLLMGVSIAFVSFNALNDVAMGQSRLGFWLNLAVHLYIIWIAWRGWPGLVAMMRGGEQEVSPVDAWVARAYPAFAILVSVLTWLLVNLLVANKAFALLQSGAHYKMMFMLLLAPLFDTAVRAVVRHLAPPVTGEGVIAEEAHRATKRSYIRVGRVLAFGFVVLMIASFWGIDPHNLAAAGGGEKLAAALIDIFLILELLSRGSQHIDIDIGQRSEAATFDEDGFFA